MGMPIPGPQLSRVQPGGSVSVLVGGFVTAGLPGITTGFRANASSVSPDFRTYVILVGMNMSVTWANAGVIVEV